MNWIAFSLLMVILFTTNAFKAQFSLHFDVPNYEIDSTSQSDWAYAAFSVFEMTSVDNGVYIEGTYDVGNEDTVGLNLYLTNDGWDSEELQYLKGLSLRASQASETDNYVYVTSFTHINHWRGYGHRYMIRIQPELLQVDTIYFDSVDHQGVSLRNLCFINDSVGVYSGTLGQYVTTDYAETWTLIHNYNYMHNIAIYGDDFVTQRSNDRYFFNSQTFTYDSVMDYLPCEGSPDDAIEFQGHFYRGWYGQDGPQQGFPHNNYGGIEWHDKTEGSIDFIYFPDPIHFNDFETSENYLFSPYYGRMVVSSDPMNEWHFLENLPIEPSTGGTIFVQEMEVVNDSVIYVLAERPVNGFQRDYEIWKTTNMGGGPQGEVHTVKKTNELSGIEQDEPQVFPIPFQEELKVSVRSASAYRIVDLHGRLIQSGEVKAGTNTLNTEAFRPGFYVLKIGEHQRQILKN